MKKLADLVSFIIQTLNIVDANTVYSEPDIKQYKPVGDYEWNGAHNGICIADIEYDALISLQNVSVRHTPQFILSAVSLWLLENDNELRRFHIDRGANNELIPLPAPTIDTIINDNETIDIELTIPFREPIFAIEDSQGDLMYQGKKYRLADPTVTTEQFEDKYILGR